MKRNPESRGHADETCSLKYGRYIKKTVCVADHLLLYKYITARWLSRSIHQPVKVPLCLEMLWYIDCKNYKRWLRQRNIEIPYTYQTVH